MDITLFTGSGIHFENDIPGVQDLTQNILEGYWYRNSDGRYFPYDDPNADIGLMDKADPYQNFLELLKNLNDRYLLNKHLGLESNYEDLYFLVEQIKKEENGSIDNLFVQNFNQTLVKDTFSFRKEASILNNAISLSQFTHNTLNFIDHALRFNLLGYQPEGLDLISQLANHQNLETLNIFSLNHDPLFEKYLDGLGINYFDGFEEEDGEIIWYDPKFNYQNSRVRIFKLHGSVDWFYAINEDNGRSGYAKLTGDDIWRNSNREGHSVRPTMPQGHFLSGYGKDKKYHFGIYADIHFAFYNELQNTNHILMSGYGWGDRVINGKLQDWAYSSDDNQITIIHPDPETLVKESLNKTGILASLKRANKINFVNKGFEECTIEDIRGYLF